jgi:Ca2+-transporting ATPase
MLLKKDNQIVAMVGDGVNDGPALKSAHIALPWEKGTEIAKSAADLILLMMICQNDCSSSCRTSYLY